MAELVVAPLLEPLEDRVEAPRRVALHLAIDGDVARIADLLGQIGRVEDELRLEVGVFLRLGEEAEIYADLEVLQDVVDETSVTRFIARHEGEEVANFRICDPLLDFCVQDTTGEFRCHRADQEVDELLPEGLRNLVHVHLEFVGAGEVALVEVGPQVSHQRVPLGANRLDVQPVHGLAIGRVETRAEDCLLQGDLFCGGGSASLHRNHDALPAEKPIS